MNYQLHDVPKLDDLPFLLEKSNRLARIDRYLAGLEEFQSFLFSVRQLLAPASGTALGDEDPAVGSAGTERAAQFEASRAREKIQQEQRLCQTYMRQYGALVQLVSSRILYHRKEKKKPTKSLYPGHLIQRHSNHRAFRSRPRGRRAVHQDGHVPRRTRGDCGALGLVDQFLRNERPRTDRRRHGDFIWVLGNRYPGAFGHGCLGCLCLPLDDVWIRDCTWEGLKSLNREGKRKMWNDLFDTRGC